MSQDPRRFLRDLSARRRAGNEYPPLAGSALRPRGLAVLTAFTLLAALATPLFSGNASAAQIDLSQRDPTSLVLWETTLSNVTETLPLDSETIPLTLGLGLGLGSDLPVTLPVETGEAGTRYRLSGTFALRVELSDGRAVTGTHTFEDAATALTHDAVGGSPALLSVAIPTDAGKPLSATLSASNVRIELACPTSGCDVAALRALDTFTSPALRLTVLRTSSNGAGSSAGGLNLLGTETFSFVTPCTFVLSSNSAVFRTIAASAPVTAGSVIDRTQTDFSITCGPGLAGGSTALSLRPYDGVLSEAPNVAKFSGNDSVGLIYGLTNSEIRTCYGTSRPWNTKISVGTLDVSGTNDGTLHWGLCALGPLEAGAFSTVVEIEAWVD